MFASNDLIHLVFADETDTYYCDNLLKLSFHQYLWLKLHEKYSSVYFLSRSENTFSVKTYGDLKGTAYEPSRNFWDFLGFESEMGKLLKWIQKRLTARRSESAAFVCSLEDFCQTSEYQDSAGALESIAKEKDRTGILVLTVPVSVEGSKNLLLYDPVFKHLRENAVLDVRTGALREMYGSLKRNKGESCVFLNTFSRDRVYSILLHVVMEQRGRFLSRKDMEAVTGYLVRYLASLELQRDHPLFKSQTPSPYMRFQDLYIQLKDEDVWKRLTGRCLGGKNPADDRAENAGPAGEYCVIWDKSSYAGKCMTLQIPNGIKRLDTEDERAADILLAVQRELLRPKNRSENDMLTGKAALFLKKLEAVSHDDLGTYKRILEAIRFCVTWMYVPKQSEEERQISKIMEFLERYVEISDKCHQARKNVELNRQKVTSGTLTDKSIQQAQDKLAAWEKMLREYQDLVGALIMNLSMTTFSDNIVEQMEELKQEIEKHHSAQSAVSREGHTESVNLSAPLPDPLPDSDMPEDDAGLYTLDDIDYRHTPPV